MMSDSLLWFGLILELGFIWLILQWSRWATNTSDRQQEHAHPPHPNRRSQRESQIGERIAEPEYLPQRSPHLAHPPNFNAFQHTSQQREVWAEDWQMQTFKQLQTLLVNYPSVSKLAEAKPDLPAKNLVALLAPLETLLHNWGYEMIGSVWAEVSFDPHLHQPDAPDIAPGELVYIRFVGYRHGSTILCPAKVSRGLPGGIP